MTGKSVNLRFFTSVRWTTEREHRFFFREWYSLSWIWMLEQELERITSFDHARYVSGFSITVSESTDSITFET